MWSVSRSLLFYSFISSLLHVAILFPLLFLLMTATTLYCRGRSQTCLVGCIHRLRCGTCWGHDRVQCLDPGQSAGCLCMLLMQQPVCGDTRVTAVYSLGRRVPETLFAFWPGAYTPFLFAVSPVIPVSPTKGHTHAWHRYSWKSLLVLGFSCQEHVQYMWGIRGLNYAPFLARQPASLHHGTNPLDHACAHINDKSW